MRPRLFKEGCKLPSLKGLRITIPDYQSIMLPLLQLTADGKEHSTRDSIAVLANHFGLNEEELIALTPSGRDYLFGNRCGSARTSLKKAGLIHYPRRGKFQITEAGRSILNEHHQNVDVSWKRIWRWYLKGLRTPLSKDEKEEMQTYSF
jgi:restriction endonuclease Mrr